MFPIDPLRALPQLLWPRTGTDCGLWKRARGWSRYGRIITSQPEGKSDGRSCSLNMDHYHCANASNPRGKFQLKADFLVVQPRCTSALSVQTKRAKTGLGLVFGRKDAFWIRFMAVATTVIHMHRFFFSPRGFHFVQVMILLQKSIAFEKQKVM